MPDVYVYWNYARRFPKRSMDQSYIFVDWNSMDLMPLASNLLTSTASTQLAQLI